MRFHLIAIGGSVMHNLAIDLKDLGHQVSGSDDEIYEPSKGNLSNHGLLPNKMGWDASLITPDIDVIILGKHAKADNPELKAALDLKLKIVSFPEFIAENTKATKKIAITGSHGKTTTTSMIMYVLKALEMDFDYLVGAQIAGFDKMVKVSGADILVVEGDEYPSSCLDSQAKMLHYEANISVITGVAWDHVNIYKTYDSYLSIFDDYLKRLQKENIVFFDQTDKQLLDLVYDNEYACTRKGYTALQSNRKGDIVLDSRTYPIAVFGQHNLKNLHAAMHVCGELGITNHDFLSLIEGFTGAAKRLECISQSEDLVVYKDFAHAPSKAKATAEAVRSKHQSKHISAILELHTFSSMNIDYIQYYKGSLASMDEVIVFYDPAALKTKQMPDLDPSSVAHAFDHPNLRVLYKSDDLKVHIEKVQKSPAEVFLVMSSGNVGGISLSDYFS